MEKGIIGKKLGMSQIFDEKGNVVPVTVINAGPCVVVQKKTVENDGYSSLKLGFSDVPARKVTKPLKGQFDKAGVSYKKVLKELKLDNADSINVGDIITVDTFAVGDRIDVTGISKGKGYAGTVKRWNTHIGPKAHGSGYHRGQGSMGANTDPSRVMPGKKMPGHLGSEQITILNLNVVKIDAENNLIAVKGAIPGPNGSVVIVRTAVKNVKK